MNNSQKSRETKVFNRKFQRREKTNKELNEELSNFIRIYLNNSNINEDELEIKFGTNYKNPITKITFENVIEKLKSIGFSSDPRVSDEGEYHLNITNEYTNDKGDKRMSNIRTEIHTLNGIQQYCKNNIFDTKDIPYYVHFVQKTRKKHEEQFLYPIDFRDFECRVNFKQEKTLTERHFFVKKMLNFWNEERKTYRYIKRFTLIHPNYPFKVDCSIVKTSKKNRQRGNNLIPEYNIQDSNVFNNIENYEIEIELLNIKAKFGNDQENLIKQIKTGIKFVLSGLQQTNYPISYSIANNVLVEYMKMINGTNVPNEVKITPRDFIGPSSISLEMINIMKKTDDKTECSSPTKIVNSRKKTIIPNINEPYTVTEKADGLRKMLFINKDGKMFLIDTNMNVQFTGSISKNKEYNNTLIDGEHVLHNKKGEFINLYLCFDIYFINKNDCRMFPFIKMDGLVYKAKMNRDIFRLNLLKKTVSQLKMVSVVKNSLNDLEIKVKKFYDNTGSKYTIFDNCKEIIENNEVGMYEYEIDGLIFTPADKSVGLDMISDKVDNFKKTWRNSLKWKPPKYNTVDFLVKTKKNANNMDSISHVADNGVSMNNASQISKYKTLILHVGYDEKKHGYLNPCNDIITDNISNYQTRSKYEPKPFEPTDPTPNYPIYLTNIMITSKGNNEYLMTEGEHNEEGDVFEDNTIVEFKFVKNNDKYWQWVPIRVRYDKTAEFKSGRRNYGNDYNTAQSVWRSINNPITERMIASGLNIPENIDDDDVYYNNSDEYKFTEGMRNFHNKYVKNKLITSVSPRNGCLMDMTVGKGGDIPKWKEAKLSFVFGLDLARDNIENKKNGVCARYLNMRKKTSNPFDGLFINANSSLNIKSGEAAITGKGKDIIRAVFGEGPKDERKLGSGVYKNYGKGKEGFDVISNQFSIHYFFKNMLTFHSFLRNVSECCKIGGCFIGTCYDGNRVFDKLIDIEYGENVFIMEKNKKIWDITKKYRQTEFENDKSSLGYTIDVYQCSINKTFSEYLVNFEFLIKEMEDYGFVPLDESECKEIGLEHPIGSFEHLYDRMNQELENKEIRKNSVGKADEMKFKEKEISFLNNYFIFKKIRNVNTKEMFNIKMMEDGKNRDQELIDKTIRLVNKIEKEKRNQKSEQKEVEQKKTEQKKTKQKKTEQKETSDKCTDEKKKICEKKDKICNPKSGRCKKK